MMILSSKLRAELRAYREELLARVLTAACPVCGARPKEPCVSRLGPRKWAHAARHDAAKASGAVRGSRLKRP